MRRQAGSPETRHSGPARWTSSTNCFRGPRMAMSPDEMRVELRKRLGAAAERVFAAFAEARLVTRWLTPARDSARTLLQFEFRVGGAYRFAYALPDGRTVIVAGTYRAIEPPSRIVFSWTIEPPDEHAGIESEVTVSITPDGVGAELHIRHERLEHPDAASRHHDGWRGALDHLAALLEHEEPPHGS